MTGADLTRVGTRVRPNRAKGDAEVTVLPHGKLASGDVGATNGWTSWAANTFTLAALRDKYRTAAGGN
jgi:hypothetical protein